MKITNKVNSDWTRLSEINAGDVFFFEDTDAWGEEAFVKVFDVNEIQCNECSEHKYNVMSLEDFVIWGTNYNESIREVSAELIITAKEN